MTEPIDIDAAELIDARPGGDGRSLTVKLRDRNGRTLRLTLPAQWLDHLVTAAPSSVGNGEAHPLSSWHMEAAGDGTLLLVLRTPEGTAVNFTVKPWQIAGMATLATHGRLDRNETERVH
ncbi:MAG TPA: hypothetical protein VHB27_11480 [Rhodopila sp.]|uniref:hypothetical protein n=1 Tax=Rhodopila sp. TaxID=2480087 RepID=UPI002C255BC1|nr:hypothetical protein [Rhodopila sp.]HVY15843.1 hypothetical protein [Rhodopila sp.]